MKLKYFILLTLLSTVVTISSEGQSFYTYRRDRDFMVSVGLGSSHYFGEMVNPGEWSEVRPNVLVGAEYFLSNRISARADLTWFQLYGDDAQANDDRRERNLNFKSSNLELSATAAVYMFPQGLRFYQRSSFNIYAFGGIGLLYFNPKAEYQGKKYALQPLQTEGVKYSRFQPVIPFGGGIKIKIDPFFSVMLDMGYRKTFTDYLDDVSSTRYLGYPDAGVSSVLTDPIAIALADRRQEYQNELRPDNPRQVSTASGKRGNPSKKDAYVMFNVKVQYYLPYQVFSGANSQRKLYRSKRKGYYRKR